MQACQLRSLSDVFGMPYNAYNEFVQSRLDLFIFLMQNHNQHYHACQNMAGCLFDC